ncbi:NlpC/P60 family protein [Sphaerisporangium album]|uniref:NlpC/P60 family protein n=1 Tax=Sphaerisporangium album TaxID=509200 RepID=A0A367ELY0_9ACTN|nr:C40 family peptidase [Sphaerisporangium album]RCG18230.1 NlpC/P60 family protein [Sphaerisporangium album]
MGKAVPALLALLLVCAAAVTTGLSMDSAGSACAVSSPPSATIAAATTTLTSDQARNAHLIVDITRQRLPAGKAKHAATIALMTAMTESSLRNLSHGDRDSIGLFQQRAAWGGAAQRADPQYAVAAFLGGPEPPPPPGLTDLPGWDSLPPWVAAQAVQRSAYPDGSNYRRWAGFAAALADQIWGSTTAPACPSTPASPDLDAQASAQPTTRVRTAITWALRQLGTPYVWGGDCADPQKRPTDPRRQNCDCSSLVQQAYRHAGVNLPRTTGEQVHSGRPVSADQVAPGDLVFTLGAGGTVQRPGHVVMYIGDGQVIQAPQTGELVKLSPWTKFRDRAVAIRRVLPS